MKSHSFRFRFLVLFLLCGSCAIRLASFFIARLGRDIAAELLAETADFNEIKRSLARNFPSHISAIGAVRAIGAERAEGASRPPVRYGCEGRAASSRVVHLFR